MTRNIFIALIVGVLFWGQGLFAENTNSTITDLNDLVTRINVKLSEGQQAESNFTENLRAFDALLAKHKSEQSPEAEMILMMKAQLYIEVFRDYEKAAQIVSQVKQEFPNTTRDIDGIVASLQSAIGKQKVRSKLVEGTKFPDFEEEDLFGKPISISALKGKVVLIDFWATWCLPCCAELPNVVATYNKYHDQGFEIISVSLDEDRNQLERFRMASGMVWPQFFDGKLYENKLAVKYGVDSVPTTYLLDQDGKIIARNLRGAKLEEAVSKALKK